MGPLLVHTVVEIFFQKPIFFFYLSHCTHFICASTAAKFASVFLPSIQAACPSSFLTYYRFLLPSMSFFSLEFFETPINLTEKLALHMTQSLSNRLWNQDVPLLDDDELSYELLKDSEMIVAQVYRAYKHPCMSLSVLRTLRP